ncbi:hypothetical protein ACFLWC_03860, partial [Chloroflexota bacterium]
MADKGSLQIDKVVSYISRLLLAVVVGLALTGFSPATVQADDGNPVDLELGSEGAIPWNITNIQPTDSGNKTVVLHNAGSKAGFVTIWLSDIVSSEGINPESETGNTAEPGELADYLLFGISSNRSSTNLKLPITINKLPQSVSDPKYIEVIPLKANDTVDLQWKWLLPAQAGNDAQGDGISFTINYLLREFEITNVSNVVTANGTFTKDVTAAPAGTRGKIVINKGTTGKTKQSQPLSEIWIIEADKKPSATKTNKTTIGLQYEAGPHGTTFDRPVTITLTYDPKDIPVRVKAEDLVIATWDDDAGDWVTLESSTVDT